MSGAWTTALELRPDRTVATGSREALIAALRRGADLRIYTEFVFEQHIEPGWQGDPSLEGTVREVIDFRETMVVDGRHAAGVTTLRQPIHPPFGFNGTDPKMAYFLYTSDGGQACANLVLGDVVPTAQPGTRLIKPTPAEMPLMSEEEVFDQGTLGPSRNFVYDMERYRYIVRDDWEEVLAYEADGTVTNGGIDRLEEAQVAGREVKVAISGLCADLPVEGGSPAVGHEVVTLVGSGFMHTRARLYNAQTHPIVRVAPAVPLRYRSFGWDVAWVHLRTDGRATVRRLDPYTHAWSDREARFAARWLAR